MNYDLNKVQKMLKSEARRFLANECPGDFVRAMAEDGSGYSRKLWQQMAEMGWLGIFIPEQYEGGGGSFFDLTILLSEMGYFLLPSPFFSSVVMGGLTVTAAANTEQKAQILPAISRGDKIVSVAWVEVDGTYLPTGIKLKADLEGDKYILNGKKFFVPYAQVADYFICVGRTGQVADKKSGGLSLFLVDAKQEGIQIEPFITMAGDKQSEVIFENVAISKDNLLGQPDSMWPELNKILLMSAVAKSAEMTGGAQRVMDMAVQYVKGREQFGRPIGAFQAIQHHCANMLTCVDTMNLVTCQAAWLISEKLPFEIEASMCKAWAGDSYRKLVALAHQVTGGFGFMEEYDLQLYFKHAQTADKFFGDSNLHREMIAQRMGL